MGWSMHHRVGLHHSHSPQLSRGKAQPFRFNGYPYFAHTGAALGFSYEGVLTRACLGGLLAA